MNPVINPLNDRTSVAYWLRNFPRFGYGQSHMYVMIDELEHDPPLPLGLSEGEVAARLEACKRLVYPWRYAEIEEKPQTAPPKTSEKSKAREHKKGEKAGSNQQLTL